MEERRKREDGKETVETFYKKGKSASETIMKGHGILFYFIFTTFCKYEEISKTTGLGKATLAPLKQQLWKPEGRERLPLAPARHIPPLAFSALSPLTWKGPLSSLYLRSIGSDKSYQDLKISDPPPSLLPRSPLAHLLHATQVPLD
jgi:hypothetical protein